MAGTSSVNTEKHDEHDAERCGGIGSMSCSGVCRGTIVYFAAPSQGMPSAPHQPPNAASPGPIIGDRSVPWNIGFEIPQANPLRATIQIHFCHGNGAPFFG